MTGGGRRTGAHSCTGSCRCGWLGAAERAGSLVATPRTIRASRWKPAENRRTRKQMPSSTPCLMTVGNGGYACFWGGAGGVEGDTLGGPCECLFGWSHAPHPPSLVWRRSILMGEVKLKIKHGCIFQFGVPFIFMHCCIPISSSIYKL